jgi:putative hydrolase of HD superfamily
MRNPDRLGRILHFLEAIDQLKSVYRAAYLADHSRNESSAEHTWHACLFALLLFQETDLALDVGHFLGLLLIHDLVEVYAGDTYVHLADQRVEAQLREREAAERLFALLPPDLQERLHGWWEEFERGRTPEARFARAIDRLQGFSQNLFAGGRVWRERGVTEAMTRAVNRDAMGLDARLAEIYEALYERAVRDQLWLPQDEAVADAMRSAEEPASEEA